MLSPVDLSIKCNGYYFIVPMMTSVDLSNKIWQCTQKRMGMRYDGRDC